MCRVLRAGCSPQRVATHPDRAATRHARIVAEGTAVTADRADTAEAATAGRAGTAAAAIARPRVTTAHLAGIADRLMAVRRGDIVAEATPRRRRTAQARSAAAADTLGHMGAPEGMRARAAALMAGAAPTAAAVRMVVAAATVAIANSLDNSPRLLKRGDAFPANLLSCNLIDNNSSSRLRWAGFRRAGENTGP
jgi:hypothetical protein